MSIFYSTLSCRNSQHFREYYIGVSVVTEHLLQKTLKNTKKKVKQNKNKHSPPPKKKNTHKVNSTITQIQADNFSNWN